jgi:hypothetical protein
MIREFLREINLRETRAIKYPDRMDRLFDVLGEILAKHSLGYGLSPQLTSDESIQILGIFEEGKEAYKEKHPEWFS